jgi:hypothetical protein
MASFASGFLLANIIEAFAPESDTVDLSPLESFQLWLYFSFWTAPAFVAAICSIPAFFVIVYAEIYGVAKKHYYIIAAMASGWAIDCAVIIFGLDGWPPPIFGLASLAFGWVGGYIYWRFAGQNAGRWRADESP